MQARLLTFADIKRRFPNLKPSRLDYLVRENLVTCIRSGRGRPRLFPHAAIEQIKSYMSRVNPQRGRHDEISLD